MYLICELLDVEGYMHLKQVNCMHANDIVLGQ